MTDKTERKQKYQHIPTQLTEKQFNEFILPHITKGRRGPKCGVPLHRIFNYILLLLHTGMQWKKLPIEKKQNGKSEIHYTRIFRIYQRWIKNGFLKKIFENSVLLLSKNNLLDLSILHGDGSTTAAKKGGDLIGYSGHKHNKGEKVVAIVDRNVNIIAPYTRAAANKNETILFPSALNNLKDIIKKIGASLEGVIMSLDGAYDSFKNRKIIFNSNMIPNIPENKRNRKKTKRGRKRFFSETIFDERFRTVERAFAWEDKFRKLLIRFERKAKNHFGMKLIAFTMINLRHFCQA